MDLSYGKNKGSSDSRSILNDTSIVALVGPGTEFEGTLKAGGGRVCLNASFKGTVASDGTIFVDESGDISAELAAKVISIAGKLDGTAKASEKLEILSHGIVHGDISTPVLVVEPGGYFDGHCHMPIPDAEKSIAKSAASRDVSI